MGLGLGPELGPELGRSLLVGQHGTSAPGTVVDDFLALVGSIQRHKMKAFITRVVQRNAVSPMLRRQDAVVPSQMLSDQG